MFRRTVKYQPERSQTYLGSPCVVRLPDGALVVTHDYYGKGCPRNHQNDESLTSVYRSEDNGNTWVNITHIMNCYWNHLFLLNGSLYIMGCAQQYGNIVLRRSDDGGFTWTHPVDSKTGILFPAGPFWEPPNYLSTAVPAFIHNGRIYKAFEDLDPLPFGPGFQALVISAPIDSDLLDASSWIMSNKIRFDSNWLPAAWGPLNDAGWREGNVIADPDGQLWNIMAVEADPFDAEQAARIKILDDGARIEFDPATGFFGFPGAVAKFTIRRDPVTGKYLSIVNNLADLEVLREMAAAPRSNSTRFHQKYRMRQRSVASLTVSDDLWNWRIVKPLLKSTAGLTTEDAIRLTGYQYTDWHIDGDDIIFVVRVADRGANNFHDANEVIYCVLPNFRSLL
ncbi:MAG: exo-alpha-sialidase [Anaerolineae bacterium]|nr:exo-alpha-sialidase [Anaerolineae bacterium]MBN8621004.1 exo-alpha-sialidase [Anaerolineae bacterium]